MNLLEPHELEVFKSFILECFGFTFDESKTDYLQKILQTRIYETGCNSFAEYLSILKSSETGQTEVKKLIEEITVAETYFFRNKEQFLALKEIVLPERLNIKNNTRQLYILSAACASGEEAYSIASLISESVPNISSWNINILGIDINPIMLKKAKEARYSEWSLRTVSEEDREKNFDKVNDNFLLKKSIKNMVLFEERNLIKEDPSFWQENKYDIIFCRNVLMYFPNNISQKVLHSITHSLDFDGYLFLGPAENLRGMSQEYHLYHTHETFYYKKKNPYKTKNSLPIENEYVSESFLQNEQKSNEMEATLDSNWFEQISLSTKKIISLANEKLNSTKHPIQQKKENNNINFDKVKQLFREERFDEAMQTIKHFSTEKNADTDVQILTAIIHINKGELKEAEEICKSILVNDELNAGAHYIVALCCENSGREAESIHHNQASLYLDSNFAMPRLHLGLIYKKMNKLDIAKQELSQAILLLEKEDASRILMFGGGFSRKALIQFCQAELAHLESKNEN